MKILIVSQYFWPENFKINDLAQGLKERGHEVVVLTGKPNYPFGKLFKGYSFFNKHYEYWNGIKIYRSLLIPRGKGGAIRLFLNYFSFAFCASFRVLTIKGTFDAIFVYEPSPITVGIPAIIAKWKKKSPIYFWVQDLWPESISAAGGGNNKIIINFFNWITKWVYKNSNKVLVQSEGFLDYITKQGVVSHKLVYYPNTTESLYRIIQPDSRFISMLPTGFKLMFAGNIGESQSFDTLLDAAKNLKAEGYSISWIILGDGRMRTFFQNKAALLGLNSNFIFLGAFPADDMPYFFACADAMIVSLKRKRIFSLTIPAKVQSYLACGKPIIGSLDGEGARVINLANAGFCAPAEDVDQLTEAIKHMILLSNDQRGMMGKSARAYYEKEFERELLITKLEDIFRSNSINT